MRSHSIPTTRAPMSDLACSLLAAGRLPDAWNEWEFGLASWSSWTRTSKSACRGGESTIATLGCSSTPSRASGTS